MDDIDVLIDTRMREYAVALERIAAALEQIVSASTFSAKLVQAVRDHLDDPTSQAKIIEVMHYLPPRVGR